MSRRPAAPLAVAALLALSGLPFPAGAQETPDSGDGEAAPGEDGGGPVLTRAPTLTRDAAPVYPPEAIAAGIEGDVVLQLVIETDGTVGEVTLLEGLGHGLDEAAIQAAAELEFTPAEVDGVVAAIGVRYTFSFRLADVRKAHEPEATGDLSGVVVDGESGAPLAGVSVSISEQNLSTRTDIDGRFTLAQIGAGEVTVVLYLEGYHRLVERLTVGPGEQIEVASSLTPARQSPNVTVVRGRRPWREVERAPLSSTPSTVTSHISLTRRDIDFTPGGMEDVVQAVGRQPGVVGDPHYGQFWIRGGDSEDTIFYLDRVGLFNPFHLAGFNSVFNPELLDTAEIFLAAAPAIYRDSLAGILDVRYLEGTPGQWDGVIDISIVTAKVTVTGAVGPRKRSTLVLAGRRTYMEPYFAVMRAAGLVGQYFLTPQFGEGYARYVARPTDRSRLRFSALFTDDLIQFSESDEDEDPLWDVKGSLRMKNRMFVLWGDWLWEGDGGATAATTVSFVTDTSSRETRGAFDRIDDTRFQRAGGRADVGIPLGPDHKLSVGTDVGWVDLSNTGDVYDERSLPTWAHLPGADYGLPLIHIEPRLGFVDGAVYVEDDWLGIVGDLDARVGVRWSFANATGQQLVSPRLGLAYSFPTATIVKLSGGLYHQPPLEPLVLDPTYGNPDIRAERNVHLVLGVDQLLPFGALVRVEGYGKWMDHLVVNPDNVEDVERGITFTNDGTGWAAGMDVSYRMRTGRFGGVAQYSLLFTRRTNPLNRVHPTTYAPPQDQRHTVLVGGNVAIGKKRNWILTASYQFHTGRPYTPVAPVLASEGDTYVFTLGDVNSERYGNFHEVDLRSELFKTFKKTKFTTYVEVLNLTNAKSDFWEIWSDTTYDADGEPVAPTRQMFTHLPIRVWFGMRLEF